MPQSCFHLKGDQGRPPPRTQRGCPLGLRQEFLEGAGPPTAGGQAGGPGRDPQESALTAHGRHENTPASAAGGVGRVVFVPTWDSLPTTGKELRPHSPPQNLGPPLLWDAHAPHH